MGLLGDCLGEVISTHSLTRRLTILFTGGDHCDLYFNSQPHEEADGAFS